ncbi:Pimeloyl-ACP methyl ester carboxylesterase [Streptoalloteichus tenebrarius]|uniref:Pimeloyl-ACP methyl ester carboxylesterase n=2 Tax=Streptoalloteichus tenebrarius (strain ATCC 17920 / DSM 40477 / JCM 4838 / CBS 697.72 / NBRC 16177 / NCIMB 11028 / NRRL B-12390 / A12253. 1 / ISP 5477) TaxID=1933 RepID=A0ABT1I1X8_STRSD|nr:Pimeloyl-ACP methyl ester carboxylesterase [Streptoalloteichus tenebrarius]
MPSVRTAGSTVHYEVTGSGPGLVMVHGTGGDGRANFGHLVDRFADARTVITPDYSGSGETTDGGGPLTLDQLVDQVVAATDAVTDEPVDLLGFSLGAVVAAATAAKHPERVRRLVLLAGWLRHDDPRHQLNFDLWRRLGNGEPSLFHRFLTLTGFSPAYLSRLGHQGLAELLANFTTAPGVLRQVDLDLRADIRDRAHLVTAPTLVVGNRQDQMVPVEQTRALHEAIPGSRYAELDSGHLVLFERPDELVALVRDFLLDDAD